LTYRALQVGCAMLSEIPKGQVEGYGVRHKHHEEKRIFFVVEAHRLTGVDKDETWRIVHTP